MEDLSCRLASFVYDLSYRDIPEHVIALTRNYILDYYASMMAGYRINAAYNRAMENIYFGMGGKEEASVPFSDRKLPLLNAAFLYATYAHGADMDDGSRKAMGHVAAPVMSAVFPLAQTLPNVTEQDVIVAIHAGYEIYCRLAAGVQPGLVHRGFHSTGTAGVIAAAAAAAKLMGLTAAQIRSAMAIACTQASGLLLVAESGQANKPMNPARAAQGGILSAMLAQQGIEGFDNPLESKKGWFHAMSDSVDMDVILENLGKVFTMEECYLKPYPSCRHTHCGLEAAKILRSRMTAPLEKAELYIYNNAIQIAGMITEPRTNDDAKFSIHYSMACMLTNGSFGLDDLDISGISPEVRDCIGRIALIPDDSMERRDEGIRGARLKLYLTDGTTLEQTVLIPKGDAANPMTTEEIVEKIRACGSGVHSHAEQDSVIAKICAFGEEKNYCLLF